MKIQCPCGTKYAFDVTPEMVRSPIKFVCQGCGHDNSDAINQLIRQEFAAVASGATTTAAAPPPEIAPPPPGRSVPAISSQSHSGSPAVQMPPSVPPPPAPPRVATLRVSGAHPPAASAPSVATPPSSEPPTAPSGPSVATPQPCARHAGQLTTHRCLVCEKPMCPKCMESFGFVCSAYCKGQAEQRGMHVPAYSGLRAVSHKKEFRKLGLIFTIAIVLFALVMGAWGWYAWVGSIPRPAFSLRFSEPGSSGELRMGSDGHAIFLHGGRLVRHDTKGNQEVWSHQLLEKKKIADEAAEMHRRLTAEREKAISDGAEFERPLLTLEELIEGMEKAAAAAMHLHAQGEHIWVSQPGKMTRFDGQTGKPGQEVPLPKEYRKLVSKADEVLLEGEAGGIVRVNLASGDMRSEAVKASDSAVGTSASPGAKTDPTGAGRSSSARLNDPARVQNLSTPARAALPAVRAASANQERLANEMKTGAGSAPKPVASDPTSGSGPLTLTRDGAFQVNAKLIGTKNTGRENVQTYRVTVRRLGQGDAEWVGELPGTPEIHSLKTVDVLTAARHAVVVDKALKKQWEAQLDDPVGASSRPEVIRVDRSLGQGPCAEQGDALYLFNTKMIAAFDLATGNVRWKEAHAETTELFFDDQGAIYANGLFAGGDKAQPMVTKIDAKTGKALWTVHREGTVAFVSGKLVYTLESYVGDDDEADGIIGSNTIFHVPAFLRIRRLDASNGRILWHHHQNRCPLDIQFDRTQIHILFRKELQTLKFLVL